MKVVIIGAGKVGMQLVESLLNEKHDVIVIDNDQEVINQLNDTLDVLAVKGNGVSINLLRKVECGNAALLIAVTDSDEANIVSCINAKKLGAKSVIARIRDPEYVAELEFIRKNLDIDYIINPELATAYEILRLLSSTYGSYTEEFAGGNVRLTDVQVDREATIIDKQIKELQIPKGIIITAIVRGSDIIIPNGSDYIFAKDTLYLLGERDNVDMFAKAAGAHIVSGRVRDVMISGGGLTAFYLAQALEKKNVNVKIVEQNEEKCRELSEQLEKALILNGDGTDISLLKAEQVEGMDAFVSLTGFDEENILVALLAKQLGAKKVIAKVSRSNYVSLIETIGIDYVVIPKLITAKDILKIIRGGKIVSMSFLAGGRAEILEIDPQGSTSIINRPLKDIGIPKGVIIGAIFRNGKIIIPNGESIIQSTDRVVVFTLENQMETVKRLFNVKGGIGSLHEFFNGVKGTGDIASL